MFMTKKEKKHRGMLARWLSGVRRGWYLLITMTKEKK